MTVVEFENVNIYYIKNDTNKLVCGTITSELQSNKYIFKQQTGWHFIPNQTFSNWMTVKQWMALADKKVIIPHSCECTVQNFIPLTDDLSIAQDTTFVSFNNTVYAWTYQDDLYETCPSHEKLELRWREGVTYKMQNTAVVFDSKIYLPTYTHRLPSPTVGQAYTVMAWDPLVRAKHMGELRPGKNAVTYSWTRDTSDNDKWQSPSQLFGTYASYDTTDRISFEQASVIYTDLELTPHSVIKSDPRNLLFGKKQITEYKQLWHKPIPNMFIKGLPIFGSDKKVLKHEGQIVIHKKIRFEVVDYLGAHNFISMNPLYGDLVAQRKEPGVMSSKNMYGNVTRLNWTDQPLFDNVLETTDKQIPTTAAATSSSSSTTTTSKTTSK